MNWVSLQRALPVPVQAAMASAASFAVGAAMPLLVTALAPESALIALVAGTSLVFLAFLGGLAARAGGAGVTVAAMRVTFWGALAMGVTAGIGALLGDSGINYPRWRFGRGDCSVPTRS